MSYTHFCHIKTRLSYSVGPVQLGLRSFYLCITNKCFINITVINFIQYIGLCWIIQILHNISGFRFQYLSLTVWWQHSDQDTDHLKYLYIQIYFSLRKVQSSFGFFPDLSFKGILVGREFPVFLLSVSMKAFSSSFFHFILLLGLLPFGGVFKFFERSFSGFPMQELSPNLFVCAIFSPFPARPRKVRGKTRSMKRGPFSVICV